VTTYVSVQHQPGGWARARVDRHWRHQGLWKVAVYYLDALQYFQVIPADDCRSS
jgi:hypothetical protein